MSSENLVHAWPLSFGTAGTQIIVASSATSTTNSYPLPRGPYTLQVTQVATGTSIAAATVVWQGSNDNVAYVGLGSATTLPATNAAGAGTATYQGAAVAFTGSAYAYGRAILGSTGTGYAQVWLGS